MKHAHWIDSADAFHEWLQTASAAQVVGADTEFVRESTFYPRLALLQLAADGAIALVDPLAFEPTGLYAWLHHGPRLCVMHSAGEDIEALRTLLPEGPPRLFDTQIAAAFAGLGAGIGYQRLVATLLGVDLPKDATRSDWTRRPLSAQQTDYAEQDVAHLHELHGHLAALLDQRGYASWAEEDCARLLRRARESSDEQPQRAFRGAVTWPIETVAKLRGLLLWRDAAARRWNVPRTWLLRDEHCADLALDPPPTPATLDARTRGLRALRHPVRAELWAHLHQPPDADFIAATRIPAGILKGAEKRAFESMRAQIDAEATRLDLPPGLLCARRSLESFISTREWPAELGGWRQDLLQPKLAALLPRD